MGLWGRSGRGRCRWRGGRRDDRGSTGRNDGPSYVLYVDRSSEALASVQGKIYKVTSSAVWRSGNTLGSYGYLSSER